MREYLCLGPTPAGETCVPAGESGDYNMMRAESIAYRDQLNRMFPVPEELEARGVRFGIKEFPHDFGTYREVVVYYDDDDGESTEFAYRVDRSIPEEWDTQAKFDLERSGVAAWHRARE